MAKKKAEDSAENKRKKIIDVEEIREDLDMFPGGLPLKLSIKVEGSQTLEAALSSHIARVLDDELRSQEDLFDGIADAQRQYRGERPPKSFPWIGCSNISVPLTRWLTDNILVRLITTIFGQKKVYVLKARKPEFADLIYDLEDGIEWWQRYIVDFKKTMFDPMMQSVKTGTGIVKINYTNRKRTIYRYATLEEKENPKIKKYKTTGDPVVKVPVTEYQGPTILPISREDFIISSEAKDIDSAYLVGFRTYLRIPQIEARIKAGLYRDGILSKLSYGDEFDDVKKDRADAQGKEISEVKEKPVEIWELWIKYDVDGDGIEDDIVVVYHRDTKTILRAIYNPNFYGFRPFEALTFNPTEYSFDGEGMCSILKPIQDEVDALHNQHIDNRTLQNTLIFLERDGALSGDWTFYPGARIKVDDPKGAIEQLRIAPPLPSALGEEMQAIQYAQFVSGVSPEAMGQPTAQRPVASEAMARLQQVGVKTQYGLDLLRRQLSKVAMKALCMFAQYQPNFTYEVKDKDGLFQAKVVDFPASYLEEGINIDLYASSEMLNAEVRREINVAVYQLLGDYVTKTAGMVMSLVQAGVHPEMKAYIIEVAEMGRKVVNRILEDFDVADAGELLKPLNQIINVQNAVTNPQPPQGGPPQGGPPQGAPGAPPQQGPPPMM